MSFPATMKHWLRRNHPCNFFNIHVSYHCISLNWFLLSNSLCTDTIFQITPTLLLIYHNVEFFTRLQDFSSLFGKNRCCVARRKLTFSIRGGGFEQAYFICVYTVVYNLKIGVHNQMGNHFAISFLDRELCTLNARFYPIREKLSQ